MLDNVIAAFVFPSDVPMHPERKPEGSNRIFYLDYAHREGTIDPRLHGDIVRMCCYIGANLRRHGRDVRDFIEEALHDNVKATSGLTPYDTSVEPIAIFSTINDFYAGTINSLTSETGEDTRRRGPTEDHKQHEFIWYFYQLECPEQLRVLAAYMAISQAHKRDVPCECRSSDLQVATVPMGGSTNQSSDSNGDKGTKLAKRKANKRKHVDQREPGSTEVGTVRVSELRQNVGHIENGGTGLGGVLLDVPTSDILRSDQGQSSHPYTATKAPRTFSKLGGDDSKTGDGSRGQVCSSSSCSSGDENPKGKRRRSNKAVVQPDVEEARKARRRELARKRRAEKRAQVEEEMRIIDEKAEKEEMETRMKGVLKRTREEDLKRMEELKSLAERLAAKLLKEDEEQPPTPEPYVTPEPLPPGYAAGHVQFRAPSQDDVMSLCK